LILPAYDNSLLAFSALYFYLVHISSIVSSPTVSFHSKKLDTSLNVKIKVNVGDGEPIESAIRRFKREVNKSGHLMELRHKRYFENKQQKMIRKIKEGRMRKKFERIQRKRMQQRV
jgi:small subunit ribosomal protein S21